MTKNSQSSIDNLVREDIKSINNNTDNDLNNVETQLENEIIKMLNEVKKLWNITDEEIKELYTTNLQEFFKNNELSKEEMEQIEKEINNIKNILLATVKDIKKEQMQQPNRVTRNIIYPILGIDKDITKNTTFKNIMKWVIDELMSLPDMVIEIAKNPVSFAKGLRELIKSSEARSNLRKAIKESFTDVAYFAKGENMTKEEAYKAGKSATLIITTLIPWWRGKSLSQKLLKFSWKFTKFVNPIKNLFSRIPWLQNIANGTKKVLNGTEDIAKWMKNISKSVLDTGKNVLTRLPILKQTNKFINRASEKINKGIFKLDTKIGKILDPKTKKALETAEKMSDDVLKKMNETSIKITKIQNRISTWINNAWKKYTEKGMKRANTRLRKIENVLNDLKIKYQKTIEDIENLNKIITSKWATNNPFYKTPLQKLMISAGILEESTQNFMNMDINKLLEQVEGDVNIETSTKLEKGLIVFEKGKHNLSGEILKKELENIYPFLKYQNQISNITQINITWRASKISGNDSRSTNIELAKKRAEVVKDFLVNTYGIDQNKIQINYKRQGQESVREADSDYAKYQSAEIIITRKNTVIEKPNSDQQNNNKNGSRWVKEDEWSNGQINNDN